jgi:gamma-glutamyltranspeptidase/glutathione hydrolase
LLVLVAGAPAIDAPALGDQAMVVTAEPLATRAALLVLSEGGNAADAAVTAAFMLAVTEPYSSGLGGGGLLVGWQQASEEAWTLDCRETAPAAARRDMFIGPDGQAVAELSRTGALSVAVPGLVRGLWDLHQRHGHLPWRRLVTPAREVARDGFLVPEMLAQRVALHHARGRFDAAMQAVFCPGGEPVRAGQWLRQPDLARTLAAIADQGPSAFYAGTIAGAIATAVADGGGLLTTADLAAYRAVWRDPVQGRYRGRTIIGMPPPSSGGVHVVQMLGILEPYDLAAAGFGSADAWHPMVEAMKLAFADRSRYLGDPDHMEVSVATLVSPERLDAMRSRIDPGRALPAAAIAGAPAVPEPRHTTHLSVVDPAGNAVAATLTINLNFGSGMIAPGTGIILNDEMDDFAAAPGTPNAFGLIQGEQSAIGPGRRPLSSMSPTIVIEDGAVAMVTGSPGGSFIITAVLQSIINVVDFGMDARQAVAAPRIHHQWQPDVVASERVGMSPDTRRLLEARGHQIAERGLMGNVQLIVRDPERPGWQGASDPRGMGLAAGF